MSCPKADYGKPDYALWIGAEFGRCYEEWKGVHCSCKFKVP